MCHKGFDTYPHVASIYQYLGCILVIALYQYHETIHFQLPDHTQQLHSKWKSHQLVHFVLNDSSLTYQS